MGAGMQRHAARVMLILTILSLFIFSAPASAAVPGDDWLTYLNNIRALANQPPVTENPAWSAGALQHNMYMVTNGGLTHQEDPNAAGYTPDGADAGSNGNVYGGFGGGGSFRSPIDSWMTGPFHGVGMIDPTLAQTGFSIFTSADGASTYATLDVLRGRSAAATAPVMFPADGKAMPYLAYDGTESPDPLAGCAGYTAPTGPPIYLLLGDTPNLTATDFRQDGTATALPTCVLTETTYTNPDPGQQQLVQSILNGRHAVVIMPQAPLTNGTVYRVTITNNGTPITWAFTTAG